MTLGLEVQQIFCITNPIVLYTSVWEQNVFKKIEPFLFAITDDKYLYFIEDPKLFTSKKNNGTNLL